MYSCKSTAMFLGQKKQNFNDSQMTKVDFYVDQEVDSFYLQENNPILNDLMKFKPTQPCVIEISWIKRDKGWSHRLSSVSPT